MESPHKNSQIEFPSLQSEVKDASQFSEILDALRQQMEQLFDNNLAEFMDMFEKLKNLCLKLGIRIDENVLKILDQEIQS